MKRKHIATFENYHSGKIELPDNLDYYKNNYKLLSIEEKPHGFSSVYILLFEDEEGRTHEYSIVAEENAFTEDENGEINGVYPVIDEFSVLYEQYMPFDLKRFLVGHLVEWISKEYNIPVL